VQRTQTHTTIASRSINIMSNNGEPPTPPLVAASSNPQSGDCAYREKNQQVIIELLTSTSSDEEEEPAAANERNSSRHSTSSGDADDVICLDSGSDVDDDDDDAPAPAPARASTESSVSSAQVRPIEKKDEPVVEESPVPKNSSGSTAAAAPSTTEAVVRPEPARSCAVFPSSARSTPAALNRQSTGSTRNNPVSLFFDSDDDDCAKTEKTKEEKDSTFVPHRPVLDNKYSDSSHDSSDDEFIAPQADQQDNIRKQSSTIEFIDSSSSEEDDSIQDRAKKTTPNRIDTIYMDSSSDDEDETKHLLKSSEQNRNSKQGPSKPRTNRDGRRGSSNEPFLILSDESEDDKIPEVAFSPSRGALRQQNCHHDGVPSEFAPPRRKMAARKMTRPSRDCFSKEAEPEDKASPATLQTEKSKAVPQDKKSQETLEKTKLKPPPRPTPTVATSPPPQKVASRKMDLESSSKDASSSPSRASLPATPPPEAASRRLDMHFGSKDAFAGSSSSSSSAALSDPPNNPLHIRSGAAHGSHLASIFRTALAEQKPLDVREVQLTDSPKEPELPPKSAPHDRILSIKRKRRYNEALDFGERGLDVEVPYQPNIVGVDCDNDDDDSFQEPTPKRQCIEGEVSRRREEIARRHQAKILKIDRNFTGGEDPPLDIVNKKGRDLTTMNMIERLSSQDIDERTGLPVSKFSVFGNPDGEFFCEKRASVDRISHVHISVF
jgi:hypothetical protein